MENKPTILEAMEIVKDALKEDRDNNRFGYYEAWKDAIVKAIMDEYKIYELIIEDENIINVIANNAAKNFLNTLINQ